MASRPMDELLVVDGYNVIMSTPRYRRLMDDPPAGSRDHDPFGRARTALVSDVAAFAQGRYEPVVVFDAANGHDSEGSELRGHGVRMVFSPTGVSADTVIERLVTECRGQVREVTVITSDNTIRSTVGGLPVTCLSSDLFVRELGALDAEFASEARERSHVRLTVEDRLDPATLAKLNRLLGR